jgi:hypothetical protein
MCCGESRCDRYPSPLHELHHDHAMHIVDASHFLRLREYPVKLAPSVSATRFDKSKGLMGTFLCEKYHLLVLPPENSVPFQLSFC